jgi:hypothetical protein
MQMSAMSLVVSWFGTVSALRLRLKPGVEVGNESATLRLGGRRCGAGGPVSTQAGTRPMGAPSDRAVVTRDQDLKARGYDVTFYPFISMDVAEGNTLPIVWRTGNRFILARAHYDPAPGPGRHDGQGGRVRPQVMLSGARRRFRHPG